MKFNPYKGLLLILRGLTYVKRGIVYFCVIIWRGAIGIQQFYKSTLGFNVFKVIFSLHKKIKKSTAIAAQGIMHFVGQRNLLQIFLFIILGAILIPHSKLYTQDIPDIPGRDTLLYKLIGPGDQNFDVEDSGVSIISQATPVSADIWRQGAVIAEPNTSAGGTIQPQEIAGVSAGGSAITKPVILPGVDVGALGGSAGKRTDVILHQVRPGEVIGQIASRYGLKVETVLWANNLSLRSYIRPGDTLKILPIDGVVHKVVRGDTVRKIASRYTAHEEDIIKYNKLQKDGSDIVVGEDLLIPGGVKQQIRLVTPQSQRTTPFSRVAAPPPSITAPAGSGYLWPTLVFRITQYFGLRHTGIDIAGPIGTPIYAARAGVVVRSQCGWNGGYGCYIIIDHGGGVHTVYGHNAQLFVKVGDTVEQGQTISLMGSTGRSTGPHLHFEVRVNARRVNPLRYVRR